MNTTLRDGNREKAALRGEPSYLWRDGQERRLQMVLAAAGERMQGRLLDNGCGVGMYVRHLAPHTGEIFGLELDFPRAQEARQVSPNILCAAGEKLPFPSETFDLILSHETLEHVENDQESVREMVRALRKSGRLVLFTPNRGYPFETHGVYWRGKYHFGNIPLVNYLPGLVRRRLIPHVRAYTTRDMDHLFTDLPITVIERGIIFGAYDNIIARHPILGKFLRSILHWLEKTPLQFFGLSHFWIVEKNCSPNTRHREYLQRAEVLFIG